MTKRTVIACKVMEQENWEPGGVGQTFEIINPFGRQGRIGSNDPEDVMILKWGGVHGATYVFNHTYSSQYEKEAPDNTAIISSKCGQEVSFDLEGIEKNQEISEVTIRGVKYVPK